MSTSAVSLHDSEGISSRASELLADTIENPLSNISIVELLSRYEDHGLHVSQRAVDIAQGRAMSMRILFVCLFSLEGHVPEEQQTRAPM